MPGVKGWHKKKPGHRQVGAWSWNDDRLWSKIEVSLDTNQCWPWQGAMSPSGALMGAFMCWVCLVLWGRRLVYMSSTNEDVTPYQVTLKCANQSCCNPNHFELLPTNRPEKDLWKIFGDDYDN